MFAVKLLDLASRVIFNAVPTIGGEGIMCSGRPSGSCMSVVCWHLFRMMRYLFSRRISMKLQTCHKCLIVCHVSGHCWKDFQSQQSNVKVIINNSLWIALLWFVFVLARGHQLCTTKLMQSNGRVITFRWCGVEARSLVYVIGCQ